MTIYRIFQVYGLSRETLLVVLAFIVALFVSIILHEISHGLVALWNGDPTAKMYGRLTLNPVKHFDLIGLFMMLIVGFGWAKPVPVNPNNFKKYKLGSITVSIAGIVMNLILAFLAALGFVLLGDVAVVVDTPMYYFVLFCFELMDWLLILNVNLALFNFLPLFPLDGYRLLSCFVNENNGFMRFMRRYSLYILLGFIVLDYIPYVSNYSPLNLYIGQLGGLIQNGFVSFWRLIF